MKNLINSPSLSPALALPAALLFMWSRNWHMYSNRILLASLVVAVLAAAVLFGLLRSLRLFLLKISGNRKLLVDILFSACCAAAACGLMAVFLEQPFWVLIPEAASHTNALLLFFAAAFLLYLFLPARVINTFFVVWMLLSAVQTGWAMFREGEKTDTRGFQSVALIQKPNVYLYFLESYHDVEIMRDVYGIDTEGLERYLSEKDFVVYAGAFSNSVTTLTSLTDLFTMRLYQYTPKGLHDVDRRTRAVLAGSSENAVFRTLKQNGYTTAFITRGDPYYFHEKLRFLDFTDLSFDFANWRYALSPILDCNTRLHRKGPVSYGVEDSLSLRDVVVQTLERLWNKQPLFICFFGGARHAPLPPYSYKGAGQWVAGGDYVDTVKKGNAELREVINAVLEKDPEALIILTGDHGAWRFRDIWAGFEGAPERLHDFLKKEGVTEEALAKDLAGIFMAIRVPGGKKDISEKLPMSTVNLFRHVFAYLGENPGLLNHREETLTSLYKDFLMAVDNKPISPFNRVPEK